MATDPNTLQDDPLSMESVLAEFDSASPTVGLPEREVLEEDAGIPPRRPQTGKVESFSAGAGDTAALGFFDEFGAGVQTLGINVFAEGNSVWTSGRGFFKTYEDNKQLIRRKQSEAQEDNPLTYLGGQVAGAIVIPYGSGARGALGLAKVGAVQGAIYGVGSGTDFDSSLKEGVKGGIIGGALGGALGKAGSAIGAKLGFGKKAAEAGQQAVEEFDTIGARILGYARGNTPIVGQPLAKGATEEAAEKSIIKLTDTASIGRTELEALQGEVTALTSKQQSVGDRAVDVTWENAPDVARETGEWRIGSLGSTEDSKSLLRAISEKIAPSKTVRSDKDLLGAAKMFADEIGEQDPEAFLAAARTIAGELGDADTAMATLRTVWAKSSQEVSDFHLMGVDWATASDELVEEAGLRIYNLATLSSLVQQAKTGIGRALRVNQLPNAEDYIKTLKMGRDDLAEAADAAVLPGGRGMNPLPKTREELSDWYELWGATGGDPRRQADFLQGILTVPTGGKYLRQSVANFFTASILSAPRTVALNILGPGVISTVRQLERLTGAGTQSINPLASAAERASARAVARYSAQAYLKTFTEVGDAFRMAMLAAEQNRTIVGGGGSTVDALTSFGPFTENILSAAGQKPSTMYSLGNMLNVFPKAMARLNNGLDEFSKRLSYQGEVRINALVEGSEKGLKGTALQDFVADRMKLAYDEVGHATDQQLLRSAERTTLTSIPGEEGTLLRKGAKAINALRAEYPETRFLLPIFNVPVNGLTETMRRLPIARIPGVNSVLFKETARELAGELGPVAQADAHGRTLLAAGFMLAGFQMNKAGTLTGAGPRDPTDRKVWLATHQPYSIRIGDQWVRYDKFDILGGLLSIPATVMDMTKYNAEDQDLEEVVWSGVGALGQWFRDRAALRNAVGLLALGEDPTKDTGKVFSQIGGSIASGFYPAALRTIMTDGMIAPYQPLKRSWTDYVEAALPWTASDVEVVRNVMGEPVDKPLNTVWEAIIPVSMAKAVGYDDDPVLDELDRLYQSTGYGAGADSTSFSYGFFADKDLKLEDGKSLYTAVMQQRQVLELEGKTLREALTELFDSPEYNAAVDADSQKKETSKGELSRGWLTAQVFKRYNTAIKSEVAQRSVIAKDWMTAAAAKRADDAYLRSYSVEELVANPALYDAAGVSRSAYEEDLTSGGKSSSTKALLTALGGGGLGL